MELLWLPILLSVTGRLTSLPCGRLLSRPSPGSGSHLGVAGGGSAEQRPSRSLHPPSHSRHAVPPSPGPAPTVRRFTHLQV